MANKSRLKIFETLSPATLKRRERALQACPKFLRSLDNLFGGADKAIVFSRVGHLFLIIALLGATGAHWAVLQSVAWATMLADHARVESLEIAIEKTFDGKHPCALCQAIAKNRQGEKKSEAQSEVKKLEFVPGDLAMFVGSPTRFAWLAERDALRPLLSQTPPVPPPRSFPI